MRQKMKRFGGLLLSLALAVCVCSTAAFAVEDGAYTASTSTYYLNPDTGSTDDAGGDSSTAIGEGMCRSVLGKTALVEVDGGKTYVTLRIMLLSNLKDLSFEVQKTAGDPDSYSKVTPDIMAEHTGDDAADYRFEIPSASTYVRCTAYVIPMSRNVVFYLNVSGSLTPGGGDFVVTVDTSSGDEPDQSDEPAQNDTPSDAQNNPSPANDAPAVNVQPVSQENGDSSAAEPSQEGEEVTEPQEETEKPDESGQEPAGEAEQTNQEDGAPAEEEQSDLEDQESGEADGTQIEDQEPVDGDTEPEQGGGYTLGIVVAVIVVVVAAAAVLVLRKRK